MPDLRCVASHVAFAMLKIAAALLVCAEAVDLHLWEINLHYQGILQDCQRAGIAWQGEL